MLHRRVLLVLCLLSTSCVANEPAADGVGSTTQGLTSAQRRARAQGIRNAAASVGITQGWLLAGIADAETQMAHCQRELTWACRGPASSDCGGGPIVAGAGDGPCSIRQGGLGMFQFDAGTYEQTLAREGRRILTVAGSTRAAVDFVIAMVIRSAYIPGVSNRAQAIAWLNGVRIDNGRFDGWVRTVTHYYNGCRPSYSCFSSRYARYRSHAVGVYREMGAAFWQPCTPSCVGRTGYRGPDCGVGDCAVYGATCVDDALGARCVSAFCEARGPSKSCHPDGDTLITCQDGAPTGTGSCGAYGATCVDDALGARCVSVFCEARGPSKACHPDGDTLISCQDGSPTSTGSCGAYGATCVDDELGARCVSVFCEARGEHATCFPDSEVLLHCSDGGIDDQTDCAETGTTCVDDELGARCVSPFCDRLGDHDACLPDSDVLLSCADGVVTGSHDCSGEGERCVSDALGNRCVACGAEELAARCIGDFVERCDDGVVSIEMCADGQTCEDDDGTVSCVVVSPDDPEGPEGPEEPARLPDTIVGGCAASGGAGVADTGLGALLFVVSLLMLGRRRRHGRGGRQSTRAARYVGLLFLLSVLALSSNVARAQSVRDIASRGACSTAGVEGLSRQLAETQRCMRPGQFVRFAPHAGIRLSSSRVHPYLQASARDALHRAARGRTIQVNSAFRTLADQYVLFHSGGCGLAASPGRSNHQSGRALDIGNWSAVRSAMGAAGCAWFGGGDPVHFDCPGADRRSDTIRAFQRLWNINNPRDRIAEDGAYGPATASRLGRAPARGFRAGGCGCTATCTSGTRIRGEDCGVGDCAVYGATCVDDSLGARCVSAFCEPRGRSTACHPDGDTLITCQDGAPSTGRCSAYGANCVDDALGARCVSVFCEPRGESKSCHPDGDTLITCRDGGPVSTGSCGVYGATCVDDALGARCVSVFCEARGEHEACVPDSDVLLSCRDGGIAARLNCADAGATCVRDESGARCMSPLCPESGGGARCIEDGNTLALCEDGAVTDIVECGSGSGAEVTGSCVSDALGDRCVSDRCPIAGAALVCEGEALVHCEDGAVVEEIDCAADGGSCTSDEGGGRCQRCRADEHSSTCLDESRYELCDAGESEVVACEPDERCVSEELGAVCVASDDASRMPPGAIAGGCRAGGDTPPMGSLAMLALVALFTCRSRRRRGRRVSRRRRR